MWRNFTLGLLALTLIGIAAPAGADNTMGQCNRTIAIALGSAQQVVHGVGDPVAQCNAVTGALIGYTAAGCMDLLVAAELGGLITATEAPVQDDSIYSPLGDTICTALTLCGLGPFLPPTVCVGYE